MLKKSKRLQSIVDIKAEQEKKLLEALGTAQKHLLAAKAQVESLRKYQQEYQDNFNQQSAQGVGLNRLLEFRSFMDKLSQAIAGQQATVAECEADVVAKRMAWEKVHYRTQGLQKACDSALAVEAKQEYKREQAVQDERAGRQGRSNAIY